MAGCADRGLDPGGRPFDFATMVDLAPPDDCTHDDAWGGSLMVFALNEGPTPALGASWEDYVEAERPNVANATLIDVLYYAHFEPTAASPPAVPYTIDLTSLTTTDVVGLALGVDGASGSEGGLGGTSYQATSGTLTVLRIDDTKPQGTVSVTGSNVELRAIDEGGDVPSGAACVVIGSFTLTATYFAQ